MVGRCLACKRLNNNEEGISFHRFPKNANRKIRWMTLLGIDKPISSKALICSDHFQKKDFVTRLSGRKCLRLNAVPKNFIPIAIEKELEVSPRYFIFNDNVKNASKSSPLTPTVENESSSTCSAPEIENEKSSNNCRYFVLKPGVTQNVCERQLLIPTKEIGSSSDNSTFLSSSDSTLTASEVEDEMSQECQNLPRYFPVKTGGVERATSSQPFTSSIENESSTTLSASETEREIANQHKSSPKRFPTFDEHCKNCYKAYTFKEDNTITSTFVSCSNHSLHSNYGELRGPATQLTSTTVPAPSLKDGFIQNDTKSVSSTLSHQIVPEDIIKAETFEDSINSLLETECSDIIKTETFNNLPFEIISSENCDIETTELSSPSKIVRYVGDLTVEHFSTPEQAKQNLDLMFHRIEKQRKKIKLLSQQKRRLMKKVQSFKDLVQCLHKDDLLSPKASRALIKITNTRLNNDCANSNPKKECHS